MRHSSADEERMIASDAQCIRSLGVGLLSFVFCFSSAVWDGHLRFRIRVIHGVAFLEVHQRNGQ